MQPSWGLSQNRVRHQTRIVDLDGRAERDLEGG
jgi:hypothetical protein